MIKEQPYGILPDGQPVTEFTLVNRSGIEMKVINYGCTITSLKTPDQNGQFGDIVLGFDTLDGYLQSPYYFGCVIGRCANRIAEGQLTLDGVTYPLSLQYGQHLHGGVKGFDKVVWDATPVENEMGSGVDFGYLSMDGEEGYPGNLSTYIRYLLTDQDALIINYLAKTDAPTIVNLTQHSYFNLDGGHGWALNHALFIGGDHYLPVRKDRIPTGEIQLVQGTPFDFRDAKLINDAFQWSDPQISLVQGLDHSWVLNKPVGELGPAAALYAPISRRTMEVHTSAPCLHVFTGNSIEGAGKNGMIYQPYAGIALETQLHPDAIHHAQFPSTIVRPGQSYQSTTIFTFSTF